MKKFMLFAVALVAMFVATTPAQAGFQMRITSSAGPSVTIDDDLAGDTLNTTPGAILYAGSVGGFTLTVNTGLSKPFLGTASFPQMDLSYLATKAGGAAETLTIEISDDGFTGNPIVFAFDLGGTNSNTTSTGTGGTGYDNALYNTSDSFASVGPDSGGSFSGTKTFPVNDPAVPYSLTIKLVINAGTGAANASGDAQIVALPVPPALALLASALPFGLFLRRRKAQA